MSRARGTGDRLTRARLALPGVISTSTISSRSSRRTSARTTARSASVRTSGASAATRWEPSVAR